MILVINLGLKSIRAIIYDDTGRSIISSSRTVNTRLSAEGWVEQDAHEWKEKMSIVVKEALDKGNLNSSIQYVTVSCSASCLVAVDENLNPLSQVIMVSDKRASKEAQYIKKLPEFQSLAERCNYSSTEYTQIARLLWIKNDNKETYENTYKVLAPNDFLLALLSGGNCITDELNAEKFFYDRELETYPNALYEAAGLDVEKLPTCVTIGSSIGKMPNNIAREFHFTNQPELIISTYDAICSVFGTGVSSPGKICDVSGTVTSVRMYSSEPFKDSSSRIASQYFPPSDAYLVGGSNNLGGGLIEWAKCCFYNNEVNPYELIQTNCSNANVESGLIFLPNLLGTRAPTWNSNDRGMFFGLERHHTRADMMRAVLESIAFSIRDFIEIFKETTTHPDIVTASGGLARMSIANEIKANITGLPYHLMENFESTSLGAAIIVMNSRKLFDTIQAACDEIISTKQIFLPQKQFVTYYDEMYGLYKELYDISSPLFEKRMNLMHKHRNKSVEYIENL